MKLKKHKYFFKNILLPFVVCVFLISCDKNRVFDSTSKVANRNWEQSDVILFDINIDDTISNYNMYINVRNTDQYRFSNLYIFMNTKFPRQFIERDTLQLKLAADDGRWLGSGLGDLFYNQILFKSNFRFPQKGVYNFQMQQGMREEQLTGIADVGLRVEKVK